MEEHQKINTLVETIHARKWHGAFHAVLDVIEPIAPIMAQLLLVFQPISRSLGGHELLGALIETLDDPDGIADLRQQFSDDSK